MKTKNSLLLVVAIIGIAIVFGTSCKKEEKKFLGTHSGTLSFIQTIDATLDVSESNGLYSMVLSAPQISPDIVLEGTLNGDYISVTPCNNLCYQGEGNFASNGKMEIINGKIKLSYGVWFPDIDPDESGATWGNFKEE